MGVKSTVPVNVVVVVVTDVVVVEILFKNIKASGLSQSVLCGLKR